MKSPDERSPDARAAAEAVLDGVPPVMRAVRAQMREGRGVGVSVTQFRALLYIGRNPGTDLSSVADHLGASMPAVSELVSRLVRAGLVSRQPDPASRRRVRLALHPEGERQLAEARGRTTDWLTGRLAGLSPKRRRRIVGALRELRSALEGAEGPDGSPT